jgi:hypothetical protein
MDKEREAFDEALVAIDEAVRAVIKLLEAGDIKPTGATVVGNLAILGHKVVERQRAHGRL